LCKRYGVINCNIQDDIVIAAAIATITLIVFIASELDILIFTLSNATDIKTIDKPSPTTDRKSTSPTNLSANPIANTTNCSGSSTPFKTTFSFSPPASLNSSVLSPSFRRHL
jgi:hypothetical protein